ncbi:MAG: SMP-30/gluconolactonase/LRE family protein [Deltaproteobacteria bacterium]|nr:SMP-30/gluconolactonase/LRE family protein [Deltaproteobacteria bacterium]
MVRSPTMALVLALLAACGSRQVAVDAAADTTAALDAPPMFDPLVGIGTVELVQGGFMFTEGPQWREATGDLVFTDIPASTIYRYVPGGAPPASLRAPSGKANGLAIDNADMLIAAQHDTRSVTREATAIATLFEGKKLNSPNDVIVADDGTIYFTDPPYGIPQGQTRELDFMGVFRIAPGGTLTAEHRSPLAARPNGIGLTPDGTALYVADTADGKLYRFPVEAGGALGTRSVHATTAGNPDGLAIDIAGNIFVTTAAGVEAFSPTGARWGMIALPGNAQPANCAFGDADHRTLYITARTQLFRVRLANAGLPRR